jgi:hypothetical protein
VKRRDAHCFVHVRRFYDEEPADDFRLPVISRM